MYKYYIGSNENSVRLFRRKITSDKKVIVVLGVSHQSAPVNVREQLAFGANTQECALNQLRELGFVHEAVLLSTCNRTEIYLYLEAVPDYKNQLLAWWQGFNQVQSHAEHIYHYCDTQAVGHLYRVACGLDSMVIGEPQILGQLKQAYHQALACKTAHKILAKLFETSFTVAKKVRTQTEIGSNPLSIAYCAVLLAKRIFTQLHQANVCLLGAGDTIELLLQHLLSNGVQDITLVNRSLEKAIQLAEPYGLQVKPLAQLPLAIEKADIVITATSSPHYIITKSMVYNCLAKGKHRPVFMVDLAVPCDIEPLVAMHEDVYLYTVDDLKGIIDDNLQLRQNAAQTAEKVIQLEVAAFAAWLEAQDLLTTVASFRHYAKSVKHEVLSECMRRIARGGCPEETMAHFAHTFTQKILHQPTTYLREASFRQEYDKIALVRKIFEFDKLEIDENEYCK